MNTNINGTRLRRMPGESEFSNMHRLDIPRNKYFTDFDSLHYKSDNHLSQAVQEENTFIEYEKAGYNVCKFNAIFDLKKANSEELNEALKLIPFGSVWAQFQASKRLGCRMFIVSVNGKKKEPPYKFWEVMSDVVRPVGVLDYEPNERRKIVTEFWVKLGLMTQQEANNHLTAEEGNFEITIYSSNEQKTINIFLFNDEKHCDDFYSNELKAIRDKNLSQFIVKRRMKNNLWHLIKSDK